jgi:hypothetical protein
MVKWRVVNQVRWILKIIAKRPRGFRAGIRAEILKNAAARVGPVPSVDEVVAPARPPRPLGEFNMQRISTLALAGVLAISVTAGAQENDAKKLAQEILDKGAALFDTRDATAMAATYTEDAELQLIQKENSTGEVKIDLKKDRPEIEDFYRDLFKDAKEKTTSRNTVEFARFITPDIMVVQGVFQLDVNKEGKYPFVQLRLKKAGKWVIKSLQFYMFSQD